MISYTLTAFALTGTGIVTGTVFLQLHAIKIPPSKKGRKLITVFHLRMYKGIKGEGELASLTLDFEPPL